MYFLWGKCIESAHSLNILYKNFDAHKCYKIYQGSNRQGMNYVSMNMYK